MRNKINPQISCVICMLTCMLNNFKVTLILYRSVQHGSNTQTHITYHVCLLCTYINASGLVSLGQSHVSGPGFVSEPQHRDKSSGSLPTLKLPIY
jgi:hypothetical protein